MFTYNEHTKIMNIKNLINVLWSIVAIWKTYDTSVIPEGVYCYSPDVVKNEESDSFTYYIIPCPYYKGISDRWKGCKYIGTITDDFVFRDGCKICNINKYNDDCLY